jgi:hypothetical protein
MPALAFNSKMSSWQVDKHSALPKSKRTPRGKGKDFTMDELTPEYREGFHFCAIKLIRHPIWPLLTPDQKGANDLRPLP